MDIQGWRRTLRAGLLALAVTTAASAQTGLDLPGHWSWERPTST